MYRFSVAFLTFVVAGLAQEPGISFVPVPVFPTALRDYFGLNTQQVDSIVKANADYTRFQMEKQLRTAQVQREIAEETARNTVDPMALGLRYMELESIRRELQDRLAKTRQTVLGSLTDAQKQKINALEEAVKLQPLISDAVCQNLLAPTASNSYANVLLRPIGTIAGATWISTTCFAPPILTGNFSPAPVFSPGPVQP